MKKITFLSLLCFITFVACSNTNEEIFQDNGVTDTTDNTENSDNSDNTETDSTDTTNESLKILSLGDSYTIGQSVCDTCRFPAQLKDSLTNSIENTDFSLDIIAQTGWTTSNLISAITTQNPSSDYDLVTLLIGVNNQYQHKPFSIYENEFPLLVAKAIASVNGDKNKLIVVSIPDYAYTPFGQGNSNSGAISLEIDQYNAFAEAYCEQENITYVYITDITRLGIEQPELVASDGLHPSEIAYSRFVNRLLPIAIQKLQ